MWESCQSLGVRRWFSSCTPACSVIHNWLVMKNQNIPISMFFLGPSFFIYISTTTEASGRVGYRQQFKESQAGRHPWEAPLGTLPGRSKISHQDGRFVMLLTDRGKLGSMRLIFALGIRGYKEQTEHVTEPAFYSCTKCVGSPARFHDRMTNCHPVSWAWMPPQFPDLTTGPSFDSQAMWVIGVLDLFFTGFAWVFVHGCSSGRLV